MHEEEKFDVIIAAGGGSVLDIAKSIACFIENDFNPLEYLNGAKELPTRTLKLFVLPTTFGSGSESTR